MTLLFLQNNNTIRLSGQSTLSEGFKMNNHKEFRTHCEDCYHSDLCRVINFYQCDDFVHYRGSSFIFDDELALGSLPIKFAQDELILAC
jgi:hypothetical protein